MGANPKYKQFITEFTKQQMVILGANLAVDTANRVEGLEVNSRGQVLDIFGDENLVLQALVNEFTKLSPQLAYYVVHGLFPRFPEIEEQYPGNLPRVSLTCTLMRPKS